jgi:hypothetical protein
LHTPVSATAKAASSDATMTNKEREQTMTNFLNMRCPKCGDEDRLDIESTLWLRVTADGTDPDAAGRGDHDYTPMSPAICRACDHLGTVWDFERAGGVR